MTREIGPPRSPPPHAGESDDEDPNSPSDGYFSNSSHVPSNVLIPSSEQSDSEPTSKAREAQAESESQSPTSYRYSETEQSRSGRNDSVTYTPSSSRNSENFTESSVLLYEPPPMYEDAVAGRPHPEPRVPTNTNYGSTNTIHNVGGVPSLPVQPRAPQSMADHPPNDPYDEEIASAEQSHGQRRGCFGRRKSRDLDSELRPRRKRSLFKRALVFLAGFLCVVWFIGLLWSKAHAQPNSNREETSPSPPIYNEPEASTVPEKPAVPTPSQPSKPSSPSKPEKPSLSASPSLPPKSSPIPKNPYIDPSEPSFPPRRIKVHETSSSVSGTYPLYDLLDISTTSGSVSIYIDPKPASTQSPNATAELRISTKSGSVSILGVTGFRKHPSSSAWSRWWNYGFNSPDQSESSGYDDGIPSRPYKVTISSQSGTISGYLHHGQDTSITSGSGSISMSFYPVYFGEEKNSSLVTVGGSGSTNVDILGNYGQPKLDGLDSRHESQGSGSINVVYPKQWEGDVDISSEGSGSITAYGTGLETIRYGHGHVIGRKGDGGSKAQLIARKSGSQVFYVK